MKMELEMDSYDDEDIDNWLLIILCELWRSNRKMEIKMTKSC